MQPQQTANNTQRLMKRRSNGISLRPHFFFSHPFVGRHAFVERLFRAYFAIYQDFICQIQQFNAFSLLNKSAGEKEKINGTLPQLEKPSCATRFRELGDSVRQVGQLSKLSRATRNFELGDLTIRFVRQQFFHIRIPPQAFGNKKP